MDISEMIIDDIFYRLGKAFENIQVLRAYVYSGVKGMRQHFNLSFDFD